MSQLESIRTKRHTFMGRLGLQYCVTYTDMFGKELGETCFDTEEEADAFEKTVRGE